MIMKVIIILSLLLQNFVVAEAMSIEDFLSATNLRDSTKAVEEQFHLEPNKLLEGKPYYQKVGMLEYKGFEFEVSVDFSDTKCHALSIWCNQSQTNNGKPVNIKKLYQTLLQDLTSRYGKSPKMDRYEGQVGVEIYPFISHSWVNQKYALSLFYSVIPSNPSVYVRQYLRGDKEGEFGGDPFYEKVYGKYSGKLPDDWPSSETHHPQEKENSILDNHPDKQLENGESSEIFDEEDPTKDRQEERHVLLSPYSIALYIIILVVLCVWIKLKLKTT